jgi:hypothetical protein
MKTLKQLENKVNLLLIPVVYAGVSTEANVNVPFTIPSLGDVLLFAIKIFFLLQVLQLFFF